MRWSNFRQYFSTKIKNIENISLKQDMVQENNLKNLNNLKTSVIRQKDESQNGCFRKTKHAKFPEKQTFLTPPPLLRTHTCAYQGVRNVRFSKNLPCFVFLKHPFRVSSFCLATDVLTDENHGIS